jgi:hypothetical protein
LRSCSSRRDPRRKSLEGGCSKLEDAAGVRGGVLRVAAGAAALRRTPCGGPAHVGPEGPTHKEQRGTCEGMGAKAHRQECLCHWNSREGYGRGVVDVGPEGPTHKEQRGTCEAMGAKAHRQECLCHWKSEEGQGRGAVDVGPEGPTHKGGTFHALTH